MTRDRELSLFLLKKTPRGLEISQSLVEKSSLPAYFIQCHAEQLQGHCSDLPLAQVRPASRSSDSFLSFTCLYGTS